jgi:hypothetical protein
MTDQEILDNAPKGATHIDNVGDYFKYSLRSRGKSLRSLADIKRIAELEKERAVRDLEQQAKGLEDYVSKTMDNSYILHLDPEDIHHCILINLNATALRLLERAKALKEQE